MQLKPNSELQNGKYHIIRVLGQGGFGITYLAIDSVLDRKVAIKEFFPKDYCGRRGDNTLIAPANREFINKLKEKFIKEAKHIANLNHSGIVKIFDAFEENETAYYVMEYIEGKTLSEIVKQNGKLDEEIALDHIVRVGEAIGYMHDCKYTHRDIKPANIMIRSSSGLPVLIDFGLSTHHIVHNEATETMPLGVTPGFSPIELYHPTDNSFTPQTDIYSLGATLYFMLTGTVPPVSTNYSSYELDFPSSLSALIQKILKNSMVPNITSRYESINSFIVDCKSKADRKPCVPLMGNQHVYMMDISKGAKINLNGSTIKAHLKINDLFDSYINPTFWFSLVIAMTIVFGETVALGQGNQLNFNVTFLFIGYLTIFILFCISIYQVSQIKKKWFYPFLIFFFILCVINFILSIFVLIDTYENHFETISILEYIGLIIFLVIFAALFPTISCVNIIRNIKIYMNI